MLDMTTQEIVNVEGWEELLRPLMLGRVMGLADEGREDGRGEGELMEG